MGARLQTVLNVLKIIHVFIIMLVCPVAFEPLQILGPCVQIAVISKTVKTIFLLAQSLHFNSTEVV